MIGCGVRRIDVISTPPPVVNGAVPATALMSGFAQSARADSPADVPSCRASFQTSTVCVPRATRFECGLVAVLTRHRDLAVETLGVERRNDAAGHAVVLRQHCLDVVVLGGQELLHLRLGDRRVPVVGVGLADDRDVARRHCVTDDLLHALAEEVGVGVGLVALDDHVVARRHRGEDGLRLHAPDLDVVEGDVERVRVLDQSVVGDDRDALADRGLATDGLMAVPSWARITSTLAPCEIRFSTLVAWVSADDFASFEM